MATQQRRGARIADIRLSLTPAEKTQIKAMAEAASMPPSVWVRHIVMRETKAAIRANTESEEQTK